MIRFSEVVKNINSLINAARLESGGIVPNEDKRNLKFISPINLISSEHHKYLQENKDLYESLNYHRGFEIEVLKRLDKLIHMIGTVESLKKGE